MTRRLLLASWLLVVYGSFIPFRVHPEGAWVKLASLQLAPFQAGVRNFSIPDVVSNVLLYVPLGFLTAALRRQAGARWAAAALTAMATAAAGALVIEIGQLFLARRVSSLIDVQANTLGAGLGAVAAVLALGRYERTLGAIERAFRVEPRWLAGALLVLFLAGQAFFPFAPTLDLGTVWAGLKHGQWVPWRSPRGLSVDAVMRHALPSALLAVMLAAAARRRSPGRRATIRAVTAVAALAVALEVGKLFFAGRSPNMANAAAGTLGALVGGLATPWLAGIETRALAAVMLVWLGYTELWPFRFVRFDIALARFRRIEWLPLASYAGADALTVLFDAWTKLLPAGLLGFALATRGWSARRAAVVGIVLGVMLEAVQLFLPRRVPATTDVLIFGFGAWLGARLLQRWSVRVGQGCRRVPCDTV